MTLRCSTQLTFECDGGVILSLGKAGVVFVVAGDIVDCLCRGSGRW
jgi:hypothetical protein